jgi:hypothetical protein
MSEANEREIRESVVHPVSSAVLLASDALA